MRFAVSRDGVRDILADWAEREAGRFVLWAPLFMILGIIVYFAWDTEPRAAPAIGFLVASLAGWAWAERNALPRYSWLARVIFCIALGFCLAQWRTTIVDAPILRNDTAVLPVEGYVIEVEVRPTSERWLTIPTPVRRPAAY